MPQPLFGATGACYIEKGELIKSSFSWGGKLIDDLILWVTNPTS